MPRTTERRSPSAAPVVAARLGDQLRAPPPGPRRTAPRPCRGSSTARPAGPGRRRAGRARSGAARRRSGRPSRPGSRSAPAPAARASRVPGERGRPVDSAAQPHQRRASRTTRSTSGRRPRAAAAPRSARPPARRWSPTSSQARSPPASSGRRAQRRSRRRAAAGGRRRPVGRDGGRPGPRPAIVRCRSAIHRGIGEPTSTTGMPTDPDATSTPPTTAKQRRRPSSAGTCAAAPEASGVPRVSRAGPGVVAMGSSSPDQPRRPRRWGRPHPGREVPHPLPPAPRVARLEDRGPDRPTRTEHGHGHADLITRIPSGPRAGAPTHPWRAILTWLVLVAAAVGLAVAVPTHEADRRRLPHRRVRARRRDGRAGGPDAPRHREC